MSKAVILGADYCPYCVKVKDHCVKNSIPFEWIDTQSAEGAKKRTTLSAKHNWKTIPMVFVNDEFVGGCDDFFNKLGKKQLPGL